MVDGATIPFDVSLLCSHHELESFDCGESDLNSELFRRAGEGYDPDEGVVFAACVANRVVGYIVCVDLKIRLQANGPEERCFYLAYMAVDQNFQGGEIAAMLFLETGKLRRKRKGRRKTYKAVIANTFWNDDLTERLQRRGFTTLPENPYLWYRRLKT